MLDERVESNAIQTDERWEKSVGCVNVSVSNEAAFTLAPQYNHRSKSVTATVLQNLLQQFNPVLNSSNRDDHYMSHRQQLMSLDDGLRRAH